MSMIKAVKMMIVSQAYFLMLMADWRFMQKNHDDAKLDYERKSRDVSAAIIKTANIEIDEDNLFAYVGDFMNVNQRLRDPDYAQKCAELGKTNEAALDFAFDKVASIEERFSDSLTMMSGNIDPYFGVKTNLLIVMPQNPCPTDDLCGDEEAIIARVNSAVKDMNLICTNCVSDKSPVCILIGCVQPNDIALFVKSNRGNMIFNVTNIIHGFHNDEEDDDS
jgi:hypothetical protein